MSLPVPICHRPRPAPLLLALSIAASAPAMAQGPYALLHSLFDPGTNGQNGTQPGWSVALDGNIGVVGAPFDHVARTGSGRVKIYDLTTGTVLHTLTGPNLIGEAAFGISLAISGTRVVVGAPGDDTGAVDAGSVYVYDLASPTPTLPLVTLTNPSPAAYHSFGHSVGIAGTWVVVGANQDDTGATDVGSAYVYNLDGATPSVPAFALTNPAPAASHCFGRSLAVSGARAVVGAYQDDTGAGSTGNAYVYDLASATPAVPVFTLTTPNAPPCNYFGYAVAISGDRVVVGSVPADLFTPGSAYIFDLTSALPAIPVLTLTNPGPASSPFLGDSFGSSVAISGMRVVVGDFSDDNGERDAGSVFVFDLTNALPAVPVATLTKASPVSGDLFGFSVAISGTRVLVGAPLDDAGATDAGGAYVYDLAGGVPTMPTIALTNANPAPIDLFGSAVALSGTRVVVGAPQDDTGAISAGKAYVYDLASATPRVPVVTLTNPSPAAYDHFGQSVAIDGTRVVIGAALDDTGSTNAGSAYVYELTAAIPSVPMLTLTNPGPASNDYFGNSVGISGMRVVVGAPHDDSAATDAGSAYIFDLAAATPTVPVVTLTDPMMSVSGAFGNSVAISGARVVVGASFEDAWALFSGSAYVYDLTGAAPTAPLVTLTYPDPDQLDLFGYAVAISGSRVVVGAYNKSTGANEDGYAYVYDLSSAMPAVPVLTLTNPAPREYEYFGWSVAISGTRVVVGVPYDQTDVGVSGIAYVYDVAGGTPGAPVAALSRPDRGFGGSLGYSVAVDGVTVAGGAPYDDSVGRAGGAAYIFSVGPTLRIVPTAPGFVTISWTPVESPAFVLQYTDSFAPTNWVSAPSGGSNPITVPVPTTNDSRFYRLFQALR